MVPNPSQLVASSEKFTFTYLFPGCLDIPESVVDSKFLRGTDALGTVREPDQGPQCAVFSDTLWYLVFRFTATSM